MNKHCVFRFFKLTGRAEKEFPVISLNPLAKTFID